MKRFAVFFLILWANPLFAKEQNPEASKPAVILVHGILNKPFVMSRIAGALKKQGYEVHNWGYESTDGFIEEHSNRLAHFIDALPSTQTIHFVGFSQGAIIIRYTLSHHKVPNVGRFVMIAPPNHGCELAEDFYRYGWFRGLYGNKSIKELFAGQNDFLALCGIPPVPFGIIAGGKGNEKGYSRKIPGDDDGTISVASAHLDGARDFILLPHQHTPLVWSADTIRQVVAFLEKGAFQR